MNDKTIELINSLAAKLGTTADHVWEILVRQARIDAAFEIALICIFFALSSIAGTIFYKSCKKNDEINPSFALVGVACGMIALTRFCVEGPTIMAGFYNPEFWALDYIRNFMWRQ